MNHNETMNADIDGFCSHLQRNEKLEATVQKYCSDVRQFIQYLDTRPISKETVLAYKNHLIQNGYAWRSINSKLSSINNYLEYAGLQEMKVRHMKNQKEVFNTKEQELTREEYFRLLEASQKNERFSLILQTICSTGIRVSELSYFTVESARQGYAVVYCKGKSRIVLLPDLLAAKLKEYIEEQNIVSGPIFVTRSGRPVDRSNIWKQMKSLCQKAGIDSSKVFPHNLRKLFARSFYDLDKDISKLADVLGHGSVDTTRIYIRSSSTEHQRRLNSMNLLE